MTQQQVAYWLWFAAVMGIGAEIDGILSVCKTPELLFEQKENKEFLKHLKPKQRERLQSVDLKQAEEIIRHCQYYNVKILPFEHPHYPQLLREIPTAPAVLYCTGKTELLNKSRTVAMVGSRRPSAYGIQAAEEIAKGLAKHNVIVVSGLADGLDSVAHKTVLKQGVPTIAVMGTGHDICYPPTNANLRAEIEQNGVVLSEIPPQASRNKSFFALRNRIIAALSEGVCVVEARKISGTMQTANYARRYGRNLFSVPGSIFSMLSQGTNELLKKGAIPCLDSFSILHTLGIDEMAHLPTADPVMQEFEPSEQTLSEDAQAVLAVLAATPKSVSLLAEESGLAIWQLGSALTELELCGKAVQVAGRQYLLA